MSAHASATVCDYCWACWVYRGDRRGNCTTCGAPRWDSTPVTVGPMDGPGVYILSAECGMAKIGVATSSVGKRVRHIAHEATQRDVRVRPVAWLPAAGREVERWLHEALADARDPNWARAEALPAPTEWFWPGEALRCLIRSDGPMVSRLMLEDRRWFNPEAWATNPTVEAVRAYLERAA